MQKKLIIPLILVSMLAQPVRSSGEPASHVQSGVPALGDNPALSDYLTYAALNNPGLESQFAGWKAALEKVPQADALPDPRLTYAYFVNEVETRVGPQIQKIGLSQMLPWFGVLDLRGDAASEAAVSAFEKFQAAKLRLNYTVKRAYYEFYYLHRAITITRDNIELIKHLEGVARSRLRTGGSQAGPIRAQVELGKLDDRLRSLMDMREPVAARLNAALNRPLDALLPWPTNAPLSGAQIHEAEIRMRMRDANPELKALDAGVRKEELSIALAKRAGYPNLMLGIDYVDTDEALMPGTPDSGKDPLMAMVGVEIPLWRGKYRAMVKEAEHRRDAARLAREDKQIDLDYQLTTAFYRFRDAGRKVNLYGDTLIPQAEQSLTVTEEAYRAGNEDFLVLVDAERLLLEFRLALERALVDREIALAEIDMLVNAPADETIVR